MRRCMIIIILIVLFLSSLGSVAQAAYQYIWSDRLHLDSSGVGGVEANYYLNNYHYPSGQSFVANIKSRGGANNTPCRFGWQMCNELGRTEGDPARFDLNLHVYWPSGASDSYWYRKNITKDQWHILLVSYQGNGYWNLNLDGNNVAQCNFPYYSPSYTQEYTQLEVLDYTNPDYYMGHCKGIKLKQSNGIWSLQNGSWSTHFERDTTRISDGQIVSSPANPFTIQNMIYANYDWQAKMP